MPLPDWHDIDNGIGAGVKPLRAGKSFDAEPIACGFCARVDDKRVECLGGRFWTR